jgi:hypothetical protein
MWEIIMNKKQDLLDSGRFILGCNYWASHAGTAMWSQWRPEVVEDDFRKLSEAGLQVLRVFPLWSDFQPIHRLYGWAGIPHEYRFGENPLPDTQAGQAGISVEMMERFAELIRLAEKYHFKLIVSLLAGWMSGRLFVPSALEGRNIITDPLAVMWQVRFVRYFVRYFKNSQAIIAWEPGNECNCLAQANREQAWLWNSTINDAIRSIDSMRPVISGMHSLSTRSDVPWTIHDQAELTDMLTTHPYPLFTPHCDREPLNTLRSCLHATAESRFYADIGSKPCLIEEIGTLGSMIAGDKVVGDYARTVLFSAWAHDCRGFLWWCGFDQTHLEHAPYDWCAVERELGLLRTDGQAKPVCLEMKKFSQFLKKLPFDALPPRLTDGVCILTQDQDQWAAAFGSFILAKQAGIEIEFQYADQPLKPSGLYFLPSISGLSSISRRRMSGLLDRVKAGAVLYLSMNDGLLSSFEEITGLEVQTRQLRSAPAQMVMEDNQTFPVLGNIKFTMTPTRARVLAQEEDGNPVFTSAEYGKGRVYFLSFPMELELMKMAGSFYGPEVKSYWLIYKTLHDSISHKNAVMKKNPQVGVTEHPLDENRRVVVMVNYSPEPVNFEFNLSSNWQVESVLNGDLTLKNQLALKANDAGVLIIKR